MNTKNANKLWSKYYIITILLSVGINNVIFSLAAGVTAIGFTIYLLSQRKISKEIVIYT